MEIIIEKIKPRILPYLAILLFIIAKIPHLYYAFYWDESWVYAPAIYRMYHNGVSLLPNAIPVDYSRGHPQLYQAVCAAWMNIFGANNFSMHCFALTVSVTLVIAIYEIMKKLFNNQTAIIATFLLLGNMCFYVSAAFVLTDIPLTLVILLMFYAFVNNRIWIMLIFLVATGYVKESGLVVFPILFADIFIGFVNRKTTLKDSLKWLMVLILSFFVIALFFIIQKKMFGWYMYPNHISMVDFSINKSINCAWRTMYRVFFWENSQLIYALLSLMAIAAAVIHKKLNYLILPLNIVMIYVCLNYFSYKDLVFYVLVIWLILCALWLVFIKLSNLNNKQQKFLILAISFCILFAYFSGINFYEERYIIPIQIFYGVILVAYLLNQLSNKINKKFIYVLFVMLCMIGFYTDTRTDNELGSFIRMKLQEQIIGYFEDNNLYDENIAATQFFDKIHLEDPYTGFRHTSRKFTHVTNTINPDTKYIIFDDIDQMDDAQFHQVQHDTSFTDVYSLRYKDVFFEVYKRK